MTTFDDANGSEVRAYTPAEVQDEFFSALTYLPDYWVNSTHYHYKNSPLVDRLSGIMHSFYVVLAGNAGAFGTGVDMRVYTSVEAAGEDAANGRNFFPAGREEYVDINDATLQYHSAEKPAEVPVQASGEVRQWNDAELRAMFYNCVKRILDTRATDESLTPVERAGAMLRDVFVLFDGNDPEFPAKIELVAVDNDENREYYIEEGENYYGYETPLSSPERSLVQGWDEMWARTPVTS